MKDLDAWVKESCYFQRKERCSDRDLMVVAREGFVALTKGESRDSKYQAHRGLSYPYLQYFKKKRNIEVAQSKGSRVSNTFYPRTGVRVALLERRAKDK
jgi:hypothetical protein